MRRAWEWLKARLEELYDPKVHIVISREHMYDLNARANRNWWYDKKGNRWPLRDSL